MPRVEVTGASCFVWKGDVVCPGAVLDCTEREAHQIVTPESEADVCPACLSWARRNRYQHRRCAVEMSAAAPASSPRKRAAAAAAAMAP